MNHRLLVALLLVGCANPLRDERPVLDYVGSSTVANFLRDAERAYGRVRFRLDTEPESAGGESAILQGRADLAGLATRPRDETVEQGVEATLIGRDCIAVIVHPGNRVRSLTRVQLEGIFTGKTRNWKEVGGPDLAIKPYVTGPASATRKVFRSVILGREDYAGCEVARPDEDVIRRVGQDAGGIGHISSSFLRRDAGVVGIVAVEGEHPEPGNAAYPIARPLYLLWWPGRGRVRDFIAWVQGPEGKQTLTRRFGLGGENP